jgi:hypothetical protein
MRRQWPSCFAVDEDQVVAGALFTPYCRPPGSMLANPVHQARLLAFQLKLSLAGGGAGAHAVVVTGDGWTAPSAAWCSACQAHLEDRFGSNCR